MAPQITPSEPLTSPEYRTGPSLKNSSQPSLPKTEPTPPPAHISSVAAKLSGDISSQDAKKSSDSAQAPNQASDTDTDTNPIASAAKAIYAGAEQIAGVPAGIGQSIATSLKGIASLASSATKTAYDLNPAEGAIDYLEMAGEQFLGRDIDRPAWLPDDTRGKQRLQVGKDTVKALVDSPGQIVEAIVNPIKKEWQDGYYGIAIGMGIGALSETIVGTKGFATSSKAAKIDLNTDASQPISATPKPQINTAARHQVGEWPIPHRLNPDQVNLFNKQSLSEFNKQLPDQLKITDTHVDAFKQLIKENTTSGHPIPNKHDFINWVTGNYNPSTGNITLYRHVDEAGVKNIDSMTGITSRGVDNYGNGDLYTAKNTFEALSNGRVDNDMREFFSSRATQLEKQLETAPPFKAIHLRNGIDTYKEMSNGAVPANAKEMYANNASILTNNLENKSLLRETLEEANGASPLNPVVRDAHLPIYFTTSKEGFDNVFSRPYLITVTAPPSPQINARFEVHNGKGTVDAHEREWTAFGGKTNDNATSIQIRDQRSGDSVSY